MLLWLNIKLKYKTIIKLTLNIKLLTPNASINGMINKKHFQYVMTVIMLYFSIELLNFKNKDLYDIIQTLS